MADPLDTSDRAQLSAREVADSFIEYHKKWHRAFLVRKPHGSPVYKVLV